MERPVQEAGLGLPFSDGFGGGVFRFSHKPSFREGPRVVVPSRLRTPLPEQDSEPEPFHALVVVNQALSKPVEVVQLPK